MEWSQRAVLVFGSRGGMGAEICERMRSLGASVVGADLPSSQPSRASDECEVDVTSYESVSAAVAHAVHRMGRVDIVVNAAGVLGPVAPSHEYPRAEFDLVLKVNLFGAFYISQAVIPLLLPHSASRLIHIASIAGKEGSPQMPAYTASKAGLIGLVKALGKEYARTSMTVNAIAPAVIDTAMIGGMTAERLATQATLIPMGRVGTPREVARLVEFIASDAASFTTGFTYDLSGGRADY